LRPRCRFSPDSITYMMSRAWPGNVRQLQGYVHNAALHVVNGEVDAATLKDLEVSRGPALTKGQTPAAGSFDEQMEVLERSLLEAALLETNGNQVQAAKRLQMNRGTFLRRASHHGLVR
jgi:DNA-binding NtrC family response regulator